jgi:uncharacterized integral membrane protein (TIGR00697 family)
MLRTDIGKYKYLGLLTGLNITFMLVCNFTAARIISVFGVGVSVTLLYFPLTYLIADILTEVYGYSQARSIIWLSMLCSVIGASVACGQLLVPPALFFKDDAAYHQIFSSSPKIATAGVLALLVGDFCNSYTLAKMKVWNKGHYLWFRFVVSTVVGEGVNTVIFYGVALYGVLPNGLLLASVLVGWIGKTLVEVVMLPVTYPIVCHLKKVEGIDFYDYSTNFNPFIFGQLGLEGAERMPGTSD